jgi:hypothetical protein
MSLFNARIVSALALSLVSAACAVDMEDSGVATDSADLTAQATREYVFKQSSSWDGGYQGAITLTNRGTTAITDWSVSIPVAGVQNAWGGDVTVNAGVIQAKAPSYARTLAPGASVELGFTVAGSATPRTCSDNSGSACVISGAGRGTPVIIDTTISGRRSPYPYMAVYAFTSNVAGATFECRCDIGGGTGTWKTCKSDEMNNGASCGSSAGWTFLVRAIGPDGAVDATPASEH